MPIAVEPSFEAEEIGPIAKAPLPSAVDLTPSATDAIPDAVEAVPTAVARSAEYDLVPNETAASPAVVLV